AQIYQGGHVDLYVDAPEAASGRVLSRVPRHEGMSLWPAGTRISIALAADEAIAFKSACAPRRDRAEATARTRLTQLLPGHGAPARRPGDRIERGRRREIDAIALETGDALLIGAGPALVPGDVDVMGDLVAVDGVGAAVAGHAAKQRFHLCGG